MVKKLYSNLTNTSQKKLEVLVQGKVVQYLERILDMILGMKEVDDSYWNIFQKEDDVDFGGY